MKHVVTGGCGFIGSHLVGRLLELGHEVVVDDLSTNEGRRVNPAATLVEGSITDLDLMMSATEGAECVFHTAAWARVPRSIDDPVGTHDVNVNGTLNVLQAARENGVGRVVYSSSSSVYGDQDTHVMREGMTPNPKSPYALHKLIGEQYGSMFARLFGMSVVSLRYFNVYGPGQTTEGAYVLVIPRFLKLRDEGRPLTIYGDGRADSELHARVRRGAGQPASGVRGAARGRERRAEHRSERGDVGERDRGDDRRRGGAHLPESAGRVRGASEVFRLLEGEGDDRLGASDIAV